MHFGNLLLHYNSPVVIHVVDLERINRYERFSGSAFQRAKLRISFRNMSRHVFHHSTIFGAFKGAR